MLTVLVLLVITGCDQQAAIEKFAPTDEVAFAKGFLGLLMTSDLTAAESRLNPAIQGPGAHKSLGQVANEFPAGVPTSVRIVSWNTFTSNSLQGSKTRHSNLSFEVQYPGKWLLAEVVLDANDGGFTVSGVHVKPMADSLENSSRFTLSGKSIFQYGFLALTVLVPVFMLWVLVLCVRTPIPRRKWAWIVFILLGFTRWSMNWNTGQVDVSLLNVSLLGAGYAVMPFGPYILYCALPLGAVVFLAKRRRWSARDAGTAIEQSALPGPR